MTELFKETQTNLDLLGIKVSEFCKVGQGTLMGAYSPKAVIKWRKEKGVVLQEIELLREKLDKMTRDITTVDGSILDAGEIAANHNDEGNPFR